MIRVPTLIWMGENNIRSVFTQQIDKAAGQTAQMIRSFLIDHAHWSAISGIDASQLQRLRQFFRARPRIFLRRSKSSDGGVPAVTGSAIRNVYENRVSQLREMSSHADHFVVRMSGDYRDPLRSIPESQMQPQA